MTFMLESNTIVIAIIKSYFLNSLVNIVMWDNFEHKNKERKQEYDNWTLFIHELYKLLRSNWVAYTKEATRAVDTLSTVESTP